MNPNPTQLAPATPSVTFAERLREHGLSYLTCDLQGTVSSSNDGAHDWLVALCRAPQLQHAIEDAVLAWNDDDAPQPVETACGLLLVPIAQNARRKRRSGYTVILAPTTAMTQADLASVCKAAGIDEATCNSALEACDAPTPNEVRRMAPLLMSIHEDASRQEADRLALDTTVSELTWSYEEIDLLYGITARMTIGERPERFLRGVCADIRSTLPYAWVAVRLASDRDRLGECAGRMIVTGETLPGTEALRELGDVLVDGAVPGETVIIDGARGGERAVPPGVGRPIIAQPVTSDGRILGVLMAGDKRGDDRGATSVDSKLLEAASAHLAIFLENARLYGDLNRMFLGTLEALTSSIDAKDPYTCGHSLRVAHLTQRLAADCGLDDATVDRMHIAGLVHDVGKIGVPERVLCKPGRLTDDEFGWIKRHPEIGHRILRDIPQLEDVLPGVLYHHERWDGRGYPEGLSGFDIPLTARLIGLADSFDAMSSTRTYRSARSRGEVLNEIERCAGSQFDPELVPVFLDIDFAEYDRLVREHRATEAPRTGEAA